VTDESALPGPAPPPAGVGPRRWPAWISLLVLVPLALAAHAALPVWALSVGVAAAVGLLLEAVRRRSSAQRAAAGEAAALVAVGTAAGYFTAVGSPAPIDVPTLLALVLAFGTPLVGWAAEEGRGPEAPPATGWRRLLAGPCWGRALALALMIVGLTLAKAVWAFPSAAAYAWLVAAYSYLPLFLLGVPSLLPGRPGRAAGAVAILALYVAAIWDFASTEVVLDLAEPLTVPDLRARFEDPASIRILAEGLLSLRGLLLTLGMFGGFLGFTRLLGPLRPGTSGLVLLRLAGLLLVAGTLLDRQRATIAPRLAERYFSASSAPWSPVHVPPRYDQRLDLAVAREARRAVDPPAWADGPAERLAGLAGRYVGRSVVLLVLESHRAADVAGLGEGALGHHPSSPRLSALAASGVLFTNYYQAHRPTHSALWELVTGLPHTGAVLKPSYSGPEAARLGRMPDFASLGYQCDWICPGSTKFDNWSGLMEQAGARFWIHPSEIEGLDRTYWTAWGLADAQLLEVARRRFDAVAASGRPHFLGALTVSNHPPYSFPNEIDGARLTHDIRGGMRYADHAMGTLVDALWRLPEPSRPVVFVTADTAAAEGLADAEPLGTSNLEGLRIPGLLLLPDGALAGRRYEGVFSHADLLDLLYLLVAPRVSSEKFLVRHRVVVNTTGLLVTPTACYDVLGNRFFEIESRWKLRPIDRSPDEARLLAARDYYAGVERSLWRGPGD